MCHGFTFTKSFSQKLKVISMKAAFATIHVRRSEDSVDLTEHLTNSPECILSTSKGLFLYHQAKKKTSMQEPN